MQSEIIVANSALIFPVNIANKPRLSLDDFTFSFMLLSYSSFQRGVIIFIVAVCGCHVRSELFCFGGNVQDLYRWWLVAYKWWTKPIRIWADFKWEIILKRNLSIDYYRWNRVAVIRCLISYFEYRSTLSTTPNWFVVFWMYMISRGILKFHPPHLLASSNTYYLKKEE